MVKLKTETDIRVGFKNFDPAVLLGVEDLRQIIGAKNATSVYAALYRGDLPEPIIRRNRQLRWSVGQLRCHLQGLQNDFERRQAQIEALGGKDGKTDQKGKNKTGHPRTLPRPF